MEFEIVDRQRDMQRPLARCTAQMDEAPAARHGCDDGEEFVWQQQG
ncbi:hypothetical protein [Aurantiacibacter luteus]|nr:hypothetical protein [Aurantiacibacter luteus]